MRGEDKMKYRQYKFPMNLVKYRGEFFYQDGAPGSSIWKDGKRISALLYTHLKEKAEKYGFQKERYDFYTKRVDDREVHPVKTFDEGPIDLYFVKYRDDFFRVSEETEDQVLLMTIFPSLGRKYGFIGPERMEMEFNKWVPREETTPIDQIPERLAFYKEIVFQILDQRDNEYLIASGLNDEIVPWYTDDRFYKKPEEPGWVKVGDRYQKWMPRDKLYIYGEEEIPPRI